MTAATLEHSKARRTTAAPAAQQAPAPSVYDVPAVGFDFDDASLRLDRAHGVSTVLMMVFGRASGVSATEIRELEGLMGSVQHLRNILATLHNEVVDVEGRLPSDFRTGVFEASSLANLVDEVEELGRYQFCFGDDTYSAYFAAICQACESAIDAIDTEEKRAAP